ncbi:MAG: pantetheine-phosphate adenylyltransferase [Bacteroidales bacterium]|jgi:pantetheine-phosphate adenylyltransferase|nr:pantetheine-phosphate adenylyltransferase [Bacteroidales bacterium]MDD2617834.1 pantetheine-phosphate adenylyltransferase [Bacteroidales bacterium]MDD4641432.1 pantetheine-phosphate adenylyltransferase [Bacteroidales bacterium]NLB01812.1 pantetheine-phosphate adenylyltransferase [Bacteroidales bacterium]
MKTLLFPGSFDPFTLGHYSLVMKGLQLFDHLIIAIGINDQKKPYFSLEKRLEQIAACFPDQNKIEIAHYTGLTGDFARQKQCAAILRGVRSVADYEYEKTMADFNAGVFGLETLLLFTEPDLSYIKSAMIRELLRHGKDVSAFVPAALVPLLNP